jgi:hypothetical protein
MSPWSAAAKQDAAKGARGGRFLLVHLGDPEVLAAPVVLEDLPVVEMSLLQVWNHPVLRHFPALPVLMGDRSRVPAPV